MGIKEGHIVFSGPAGNTNSYDTGTGTGIGTGTGTEYHLFPFQEASLWLKFLDVLGGLGGGHT